MNAALLATRSLTVHQVWPLSFSSSCARSWYGVRSGTMSRSFSSSVRSWYGSLSLSRSRSQQDSWPWSHPWFWSRSGAISQSRPWSVSRVEAWSLDKSLDRPCSLHKSLEGTNK